MFFVMTNFRLPRSPVGARITSRFTCMVDCAYGPEKYQASDEEWQDMCSGKQLETASTSIAEYVWLSLKIFSANKAYPRGKVEIT